MKTILASDGNENIRLLLETELSLEGYKVILASTGLKTMRERENPYRYCLGDGRVHRWQSTYVYCRYAKEKLARFLSYSPH